MSQNNYSDRNFSTTSSLNSEPPVLENELQSDFNTVLFLPENKNRLGVGGLRTKNCFKKSYKNKPLISIVTVVFNGEKTLEHTIKSVIQQSYDNVEYIIIDGGSNDGTLDIIKKYENQIDYWVSEPDKGIYDAMNKGVRAVNGEWVYFLGADDILYDILQKIAEELNPLKKAVYGDVYMPNKHKLYDGKFTRFKLMFNNICHQAIFYNKKVFINNGFNLKYKILADYAFNLSIYNEQAFKYVPILVSYYNDSDGVSSLNKDDVFQNDRLMLIKNNFPYQYYLYFKCRKLMVKFLSILKIKSTVKRLLKR